MSTCENLYHQDYYYFTDRWVPQLGLGYSTWFLLIHLEVCLPFYHWSVYYLRLALMYSFELASAFCDLCCWILSQLSFCVIALFSCRMREALLLENRFVGCSPQLSWETESGLTEAQRLSFWQILSLQIYSWSGTILGCLGSTFVHFYRTCLKMESYSYWTYHDLPPRQYPACDPYHQSLTLLGQVHVWL
jgi:hypothetical protein